MKKYLLCLLLIVSCILQVKAQKTFPLTSSFNNNWEFVRDIDTTTAMSVLTSRKASAIAWEKVSLPHTPRIEPVQKVEEQWQGTCYYRKYFSLPVTDKWKHIAIQFDGAMNDADVYVNGKHMAKHIGGYLPFSVDLSKNVRFGEENYILVKLVNVDNPLIPPGKPIKDLDFNFYGGIYRNAWLIEKSNIYIGDPVQENREAGGGVMVHYEDVSAASAKVIVKTDVQSIARSEQKIQTNMILIGSDGKTIATSRSAMKKMDESGLASFEQHMLIPAPHLWSPTHPYLYRLVVQVVKDGKVIDEQRQSIGIKTYRFEAGGFYLNGEKLNIEGTNRHQEYPYIGYALSDNAQYRDAWKIKDAGFNFVRCSHYPPSPAFLDACDELGIMVMDAIPGWQFFGGKEFQENSFQNIRDMIHRDRNHASIVLWEASLNETGMTKDYMDKANKIAHAELPFAGVYTTGWQDYAYDVFNPARQHMKAPNYWKKYSHNKPMLLAEYGDWEYYAQNAGFNQKAYSGLKSEERNSRQLRSDGQQRLLQQELNFQEAHNDDLNGPGVGDANWVMFDYKRGYAKDLESSGIMDIFRLPKLSFYFYQSQNGPRPDDVGFGKPMVSIANYWNDPKQKTVKVFSNCDQVELFVNGTSLGIHKPDTDAVSKNLAHAPFTFEPDSYTPGTLTAVGYTGGKKAVSQTVNTPGEASKLVIKTDLSGKKLAWGKNDVIFVYAYITDQNGNPVPGAANSIKFAVKGAGSIVGPSEIKAEAGIATILLRGNDHAGKIQVTASSDNLKASEVIIQ